MSLVRSMNVLSTLLHVASTPLDYVSRRTIAHDTAETSRERRKRKAAAEKKKARKNVKASRKKNRK